jgi:1-acyl-sn-glycerol-3-phosphate acyltransferase
MICWIFKKFAQWIPNVEHHVTNLSDYNFEKPSILICNHQSHLDLMYTLMLHPKIICLTNNWVWNCPFYGRIIRFAEYYPISNGIEESMETLKSAIDRGYSILIFPEGTRSEDGRILRFHQGAFHLADKFKIDIVPIIIHGINHVFPKKEFLLRKGRIDVRIMPTIQPDHELRNGIEPRKAAQAIRKYYQQEYAAISKEIETADYFKDLVYHNYIYKGAEIAREVKKSLFSTETDAWLAQLPEEGEITIGNCGWGEKTLLAALVKKELIIIAHEQDEEKLSVARNCASIPPNLKYE